MNERETRRIARVDLHDEIRKIARSGDERLYSTVDDQDGFFTVVVEKIEPRMEVR